MRAQSPGALPGFRLFPGHDDRVLDHVLADPACARIVLRRNPVDSFLSYRIARENSVWRVGPRRALPAAAPVRFDAAGFADFLDDLHRFHDRIRRGLLAAGQTALWVSYDELLRPGTVTGIARHVGSAHPASPIRAGTRKQNPAPALAKVTNPLELARMALLLDRAELFSSPEFEPPRRVGSPDCHMMWRAPLLFLPLAGTDSARVIDWMRAQDMRLGTDPEAGLFHPVLLRRVERWVARRPGHLRFSWAQHPLDRAHAVLWHQVIAPGAGHFARLRQTLAGKQGVTLPESADDPGFDAAAYREALLGFLRFVQANHARQTDVRVNRLWASQAALIEAVPPAVRPHHLFRGDELDAGLGFVATRLGLPGVALPPPSPAGVDLAEIYDADLEKAARAAYRRDYAVLGFDNWRPGA
jgi:hypothetical protein